jgi:integrase
MLLEGSVLHPFLEQAMRGRKPKPWYWEARDGWYVTLGGKRVPLVEGKKNRNEAYRRFLNMADNGGRITATGRVTGKEVCGLYVEHAKLNLKKSTAEWYKQILDGFGRTVGSIDANDVLPKNVTKYLAKHTWGPTTRYNNITAIKRAWAWAKDEGHITLNGLIKLKRPRPLTRDEIPDEAEIRAIFSAASPEFLIFLRFLNNTGCRPGEASIIHKRHVKMQDCEVRFKIGEDKTSAKTGKQRVIHLNGDAAKILEVLIAANDGGPLFLNSRGNAWTKDSIKCAMARIRERTGLDSRAVAYAIRHHYITDALAQGVPLSTVAEMVGNSPEVIAKVYSHLSDKKSLLMEAANRVRPSPTPSGA